MRLTRSLNSACTPGSVGVLELGDGEVELTIEVDPAELQRDDWEIVAVGSDEAPYVVRDQPF
jgi:hypothetical protein